MTKRTYICPDVEILPIDPECVICTSGEGGDLIIDDLVNPWNAAPYFHNLFED